MLDASIQNKVKSITPKKLSIKFDIGPAAATFIISILGLFRLEGDRWVFAGPLPDAFKNYSKDHAELLVRYMFQLTAAEQRRLISRLPTAVTKIAGR